MKRACAVLIALGLWGCSGGDPSDVKQSADEESVFDPMTSTIDRAQDVEDQMNQRVDELNERLEENEGR